MFIEKVFVFFLRQATKAAARHPEGWRFQSEAGKESRVVLNNLRCAAVIATTPSPSSPEEGTTLGVPQATIFCSILF